MVGKYVMINGTVPIFFPTTSLFKHDRFLCMFDRKDITSAAFFSIIDGEVMVYGESASLGIGPGKRDAEIIKSAMEIIL